MAAPGAADTRTRTWWGIAGLVEILYALIPVLWIVSLSFKTADSITDGNFIPRSWTLENYAQIFSLDIFTSALRNSIGISIISTVLAVVVGTMAAYAIARLDFPGKKALGGCPLLYGMFRRSRWSARFSRSSGRWGCSTPGRG